MDDWAYSHQRSDLFAQIGNGTYLPSQFPWVRELDPPAFEQSIEESALVISHAGMGNLINALRHKKPIILLPRRADLHEMTTDHQLDAVQWLKRLHGVWVCESEIELPLVINRVLERPLNVPDEIGHSELDRLIEKIKAFIGD